VTAIGRILDRLAEPGRLDAGASNAFTRVVRFELRFWDAVHAGERW
jgi:thiaminase